MNMNSSRAIICDALLSLEAARDELRDLDAAIGDGDLGITVTAGARAVRESIRNLAEDAELHQVLMASAKQFGSANPSTFAALISGGLLAASKVVVGVSEIDTKVASSILQAVFESIKLRGKANLGDKTILDAIHPALIVMQENRDLKADDLLPLMIEAVEASITESASLVSQRGRAAWVGERTIGHRDGGATAFLRFLEALSKAVQHSGNKDASLQ